MNEFIWQWLYNLSMAVGIPLLRGIIGWVNVSLADGKIDSIEYKKLIETVFRVGIPAMAAFIGIDLLGFDVNILVPLIAASIYDWYVSMHRKMQEKASIKVIETSVALQKVALEEDKK